MQAAHPRLKFTFSLNLALLLAVCALEQIPFTGAILHEWLGLTFAAMIVVHLLLSWAWISSQTKRVFRVESARSLVNYVLNLSLFAAVTTSIYSGITISQEAIPAIAKTVRPVLHTDSAWVSIHDQSSNFVITLAALLLALNWDWSVAASRTIFRRLKAGAR
jgi:hypothetical protein